MRYAIVTETYPPEINGVALTVEGLAQGLRARGHSIDLVRPRQSGDGDAHQDALLVHGFPLPRYPGLRFGAPALRTLARHWNAWRPDAVYIATEGPLGWAARRVARRLRVPVATGFHTRFDHYMRDYGFGVLEPIALRWMRRFHNAGDATLVATRQLQDELAQHRFANPMRLARAVDGAQFHPAKRDARLRESWGAGDGTLVALHVGRIAAEKNLGLAIAAFRAMQRVRSGSKMVFVGDGPLRASLAQANPDIVFAGLRRGEDLARHFASGDVFLFPSRSETFGNVTLEAMASGVATIAFDYGAAREHLRHGQSGLRVPDGDAAAFITSATQLSVDDVGLRRMRVAARAGIEHLHPDQVAAQFDALLQMLANRRRIADAQLAPD
ncbi:Glycosyl transferase [Lysobacter dokdonensis DS-58]|uniref:Glycosyl transferase n=1 Tax=Lysobacter dokdonensis DS-58 TaxID=1300345 RepID=A0A0A2WN77_9GAMM|nr:glycosyltransferase family 1 protein [Lysobacter dokdonensis]KGQ19730.1 Glycosyl transferase [Lysobacter dokdonensis DS-58]